MEFGDTVDYLVLIIVCSFCVYQQYFLSFSVKKLHIYGPQCVLSITIRAEYCLFLRLRQEYKYFLPSRGRKYHSASKLSFAQRLIVFGRTSILSLSVHTRTHVQGYARWVRELVCDNLSSTLGNMRTDSSSCPDLYTLPEHICPICTKLKCNNLKNKHVIYTSTINYLVTVVITNTGIQKLGEGSGHEQ